MEVVRADKIVSVNTDTYDIIAPADRLSDLPWWLKIMDYLDFTVFKCRIKWFCYWVHDLEHEWRSEVGRE